MTVSSRASLWSSRWTRAALVLLLALYLVLALAYTYRTSFVSEGERVFCLWDDAMISMRYARNLAHGDGLVWNRGERVQGFTNLGLTLLMAGLHFLPLSANCMPLAFQVLNVGWLLAIVYLGGEFAAKLGRSRVAGVSAATVLALFAPLGIWGVQGADSAALALVLLVASMQAFDGMEQNRPAGAVFVTLAAGVLVRLDFTLDYLLFLAFLAWKLPDRKATLVRGGAVLALTVGGMLLFGALYYGDPLPNTYYLKATGADTSAMLIAGMYRLVVTNLNDGFYVSLALFALYAPALVRAAPFARLLVAVVIVSALYYVRVGGDWATTHFSRFLVPAIPLYVAVLFAGARATAQRFLPALTPRARAGLLALHVPLLVFTMNKRVSLAEWWSPAAEPVYKEYNVKSLADARYLSQHTTPDTTVAVFWAGVMPYHCDRPMLDVLGKADPHIARVHVRPGPFVPGHAKRDWKYVFEEKKPDLFVDQTNDMKAFPAYAADYCLIDSPVWIAARKDSLSKLLPAGTACRSRIE